MSLCLCSSDEKVPSFFKSVSGRVLVELRSHLSDVSYPPALSCPALVPESIPALERPEPRLLLCTFTQAWLIWGFLPVFPDAEHLHVGLKFSGWVELRGVSKDLLFFLRFGSPMEDWPVFLLYLQKLRWLILMVR